MSYGVGYRGDSTPALLWLWCRLAAVAPIQPLAWELPCAAGAAFKKKKKKERKGKSTALDYWFDLKRKKNPAGGVPTVLQWVKNITASAQVAAELQIWSLAPALLYATGEAITNQNQPYSYHKNTDVSVSNIVSILYIMKLDTLIYNLYLIYMSI